MLFRLFVGKPADLAIFNRHDLVHDLNHGDINTHGVIKACKLNADGP